MMKKYYLVIVMSVLAIAAQAEKIDSSQFVAFYNYTIQTQDGEGQDVCDTTRLALLVGTHATCCTDILSYNKDARPSQEMMNVFMMHQPNVLTDVEKSEVVAVEPIYPYRYLSKEPLAKVNWTLTEDTLSISGLFCHRATGKLYGKQWTAWYTEEIPSSAGPWKLRGLPGLIVKAEDSESVHCFMLYETKNEVKDINMIGNPDYQQLSRKKLMEFKKKTLGNIRYAKEPTYYVPDDADVIGEIDLNGTTYYVGMNSHMMVPQKAHVYQPLELE